MTEEEKFHIEHVAVSTSIGLNGLVSDIIEELSQYKDHIRADLNLNNGYDGCNPEITYYIKRKPAEIEKLTKKFLADKEKLRIANEKTETKTREKELKELKRLQKKYPQGEI